MLTLKEVDQVKVLAKGNPAVAAMLKEWTMFSESPYIDSYITLFDQIVDWNKQLKLDVDGSGSGKINILDNKDTEKFEKVHKYFKQMIEFHETLDALRTKMTPEQIQVLSKKMDKNTSVAL